MLNPDPIGINVYERNGKFEAYETWTSNCNPLLLILLYSLLALRTLSVIPGHPCPVLPQPLHILHYSSLPYPQEIYTQIFPFPIPSRPQPYGLKHSQYWCGFNILLGIDHSSMVHFSWYFASILSPFFYRRRTFKQISVQSIFIYWFGG